MAVLYVTEFDNPGQYFGHVFQVAAQPPRAEQTVSIGASSTQSSAFDPMTTLIRVHTDAICSIEVGLNPTATATKARMAANQTEYFFIPRGLSWKIAVITNS